MLCDGQALIDTNEYEIYEQLSSVQIEIKKDTKGAVGSQFVSQRAKIILEEVRQLALFTRAECLQFIGWFLFSFKGSTAQSCLHLI